MPKRTTTAATDRLVDEARTLGEAIEDEAYDQAIDAVGDCARYDVGETEMVKGAYGDYVLVEDAQAAIRTFQR